MVIEGDTKDLIEYEVKFHAFYDNPCIIRDVWACMGSLYVRAKDIFDAITIATDRLKKQSGWEQIEIYSVFDTFYKKMEE